MIIVDNGSAPAFVDPHRIIRNEQNLGFPKAVNQGIKAATGDIIVILNNDTLVTPGWLDRLEKHLETYDIVGPVTNSISGPQQVPFTADTFQIPAFDIIKPWHRLVFFCVAIKRGVIDKIGLLDEQFSPGNFEDDDYCLRAIEAGFKLGIAFDVFITHLGSATHKSLNLDHQKLLQTNLAKFQAKWSESKYQELIKKNNLFAPILGLAKKPTLALVMVVKNEEKGLEAAILSCRDFVDEIVVAVDNSTTDKTEEIAKKYATTLKHFDWQGDFAAARNFAHAGVKSDWILFLDGHEFVKQHDKLDQFLKCGADALLCAVEMDNGVTFRNPRIYRNGIQFAGAVHEMQDTKNIKPYPDFIVKHNRVGAQSEASQFERTKQRAEMVPRIMGERYRKNKKDCPAVFHLALYAQSVGKTKEAIMWFKRYLKYADVKGARWFAYFQISLSQLLLNRYWRAFWAASRADWETPGRWEINELKGMIFFAKGEYTKAVECLVNTFYQNTGDVTFKPIVRNDTGTWSMVGECYFKLGIYDKAQLAFEMAAKQTDKAAAKSFLMKRADLMTDLLKETLKARSRM